MNIHKKDDGKADERTNPDIGKSGFTFAEKEKEETGMFSSKRVKNLIVVMSALAVMMWTGCAQSGREGGYQMISAEEAKELMEKETDYILLDVRTQEEYEEGHIEGAVLIPDYEIMERAETELADKQQLILVYCRSGNRSKRAAQQLADMGYENVKEFGGIIDWPYEVITE